ncbi:hypothetical protein FT663_05463 [Candidozyma haemuli var. vulneris]|nr:hypothetical protein FT662_05488 [[Candida] haemuloni var. vulneris]KAF3985016.1 hypothetical protein FT663_05463 [[Candida] haemuloni var. vulneris]
MSTAVFYQPDQLGVEEVHQNHHHHQNHNHSTSSTNSTSSSSQNTTVPPLPPLAHLMPLSSSSQTAAQTSTSSSTGPAATASASGSGPAPTSSDFMYPVVSSANSYPGYQASPEVAPQSSSYHSSINNTPATPLNNNYTASAAMLAPHNSIPGPSAPMMAQHPLVGGPGPSSHPVPFAGPQVQEKCTCKSNPNRIPRPRNAFILFRQKYHQSVLDESTEAKTNPEVSRELGRRWRSLSPQEREHWTNLAEEEKKNHAKKYPNYRYTPRRHGKGKHCPSCQQKHMRQAQMNQQQQQQQQQQKQNMMRSSSSDQDGLLGQQNLQKSPLNQSSNFAPQMQPFSLQQQYSSGQQSLSGQPLQQPLQQSQQPQQQGNPYMSSQMGQFVFQSPFNQVGPQFGFPEQQQQQPQQQQQQQQAQGSPQQQVVSGQGQGQHPNEKMGFVDMNQPHFMGYEQGGSHQQRFNSLPTAAMGGSSYNGHEVYMQPQAPHQR